MNDLISIVVPIYNVEKYVSSCIESILKQTYTNIEILLVDDGATDNSGEICEKYALMDERIRVIHKSNGGLVSARKAGILAAKGNYIGFVDGDDWIEPDMYEHLYKIMINYDVKLVSAYMFIEYEETGVAEILEPVKTGLLEQGETKDGLHKDIFEINFPGIWSRLFEKSLLEQYYMCIPDEISLGEDCACVYPCIANLDKMFITEKPVYHYRIHKESMIRKVRKNGVEKYNLLYAYIKNKFEKCVNKEYLLNEWRVRYLYFMTDSLLNEMGENAERAYRMDLEKLKGKNIILYGAGKVGKAIFSQLSDNENIILTAWVDRYKFGSEILGKKIDELTKIGDDEYDYIVIGVLSKKVAMDIKEELINLYMVKPEKIIWERYEQIWKIGDKLTMQWH